MNQEELNSILRRHKAWLNGEDGGERAVLKGADLHCADLHCADLRLADLRYSDLRNSFLRGINLKSANLDHADLQRANLQGAYLQGADMSFSDMKDTVLKGADLLCTVLYRADMRGANIDDTSWPLRCGFLQAYVDDRIAIQLLYHTLSVVQHSPYVSEEVKAKLLTTEIVSLANRFHRVGEYRKIKKWEEGTK